MWRKIDYVTVISEPTANGQHKLVKQKSTLSSYVIHSDEGHQKGSEALFVRRSQYFCAFAAPAVLVMSLLIEKVGSGVPPIMIS